MGSLMISALALILCGAFGGFMAGLLGIGGGALMVPALYEVFGFLGVGEDIRTHMAVATSLSVILPTGLLSAWGHHKKGTVAWDVVKVMGPMIVLGVALGALIAKVADGSQLRVLYASIAIFVGCFLLWSRQYPDIRLSWPSDLVVRAYALMTGLLSTLMGIGGGTFTASFMSICGRSMHAAVGTAAAIGPIIALPAIIGFIWAGWGEPGLPPGSAGYVSLVGAALLLPSSLLMAPVGVKVAHLTSRSRLTLLFAIFLLSIGARFILSVIV